MHPIRRPNLAPQRFHTVNSRPVVRRFSPNRRPVALTHIRPATSFSQRRRPVNVFTRRNPQVQYPSSTRIRSFQPLRAPQRAVRFQYGNRRRASPIRRTQPFSSNRYNTVRSPPRSPAYGQTVARAAPVPYGVRAAPAIPISRRRQPLRRPVFNDRSDDIDRRRFSSFNNGRTENAETRHFNQLNQRFNPNGPVRATRFQFNPQQNSRSNQLTQPFGNNRNTQFKTSLLGMNCSFNFKILMFLPHFFNS